jgi:sulfate/thiosulfate transport system substrate-binding protein
MIRNLILIIVALIFFGAPSYGKGVHLLNVSYDPTRELYQDINTNYKKYWDKEHVDKITINQSHGGSRKQAKSIIYGLKADVATLALEDDIDKLVEAGLVDKDWKALLPNDSSPYSSTILFLVRKNNPKNIKDWNDLIRPDVQVVTANPKTSGGAIWNYLAAWAYALKNNDNDKSKAISFINRLFKNVAILDITARGSTVTFVKRGIGDVLLTWENEAYLTLEKMPGQFEIVAPSLSIDIKLPVAVISKYSKEKGTYDTALEYLNYLFSKDGQNIIAKHYYRPYDKEIFNKYNNSFQKINLVEIRDLGSWENLKNEHFSDNGVFDQIFR